MNNESTGTTVMFELDLESPAPLTMEQEERLDRLRAMKDDEIDFSDIPKLRGDESWTRPGLSGLRPGKSSHGAVREKMLPLEEDVVRLFEELGENDAPHMNAVLREYAVSHRKSA